MKFIKIREFNYNNNLPIDLTDTKIYSISLGYT